MAGLQIVWGGATDGDWGTATNWIDSTGATGAPEAGDESIVPANASVNIDGSKDDTLALDAVKVEDGCSITFGSATAPLQIDLADSRPFYFGGTGNAWIDCSGASATYTIANASTGAADGSPGLYLTGGEAGSVVNIETPDNAHVGLCARDEDAGIFATVNLKTGTLTMGVDCTATTINLLGGGAYVSCGGTTLNVYSGVHYLRLAAAYTAINIFGGKVYNSSSGTQAAVKIYDGGQMICDSTARTFTNCDLHGNGQSANLLVDETKSITFTNPASLNGCGLKAMDRGVSMNVALTALS